MTSPDDDFAAPLKKLGIRVEELTIEKIIRRHKKLAKAIAKERIEMGKRALMAESICARILDSIYAGDLLRGIRKGDDGKPYLRIEFNGGDQKEIPMQPILDFADLIRGDKPA